MGASFQGYIYMTGGRGTWGVGFYNDVWRSRNGSVWEQVTGNAPWGKRAYHIMLVHNDALFLIGGQNFGEFFHDVWKSTDGVNWECVSKISPFHPRAGLAAVSFQGRLLVTAGSFQTTPVSPRSFFGDVFASADEGATWTVLTAQAAFEACSGPRLVVMGDKLVLVAGEVGFSSADQLNQVYVSADGVEWLPASTSPPPFSNRSGHGLVVAGNSLLLIGGWPRLHDLWASNDGGASWGKQSDTAYGCTTDACGRFDFWSMVHEGSVYVFGGSGSFSTFGPPMYTEVWALDDAVRQIVCRSSVL
jgi:hypothetical protein